MFCVFLEILRCTCFPNLSMYPDAVCISHKMNLIRSETV